MPKVLLLHTGGTLGMAAPEGEALKPGAFFQTLRRRAPELFELAEIELELFSNLDSCEMQPELWSRMARHLHGRMAQFDGVVVTHGTDTLAYTASALSFMLQNLGKAVVLTGSQRPLGDIRTDARLNLIDSVISALRGPREVTVCFDSKLFRGNRVRKVKVSEYDAFESPNFPLLGTLGVDATFARGLRPRGKLQLRDRLDTRVFLLKVFPGMDPNIALEILRHVRGVVMEGYGAGNFPISAELGRSLRPFFDEARARQVPVVITSQAYRNAVDLSAYEAGELALERGAIGGGDLTTPAAVVKLMQAIAYYDSVAEVARYLRRPVAGELTR